MKVCIALCLVALTAVSALPQFPGFAGARTVTLQQPFRPIPQQVVTIASRASYNAQPAQHIAILRSEADQSPDGSYHYAYETENGIAAQEQGQQRQIAYNEAGTVAQGQFSYTSPEGQQISVQYVADENGFQPQGNALPVPPPVPEAILRSLEYNAAHPEEDNL